jgi:hypothetical protein
MFASKNLFEHLLRGAAGIGGLVGSATLMPSHPVVALALFPLALVALRGCPMCWTVGLVQTVVAKLQGKTTAGLCTDGSCELRDRSV